MPPMPVGKKAKNVGSPLDAAQRQVRGLYGRASTTASKNATSAKQAKAVAPKKAVGGGMANKIERAYPVKAKAPRPTRGGGSFAGDLAKFGSAVKRGKAAASPSTAKRTGLSKEVGKTSGVKRLPKTM